MRGTHRKFTSRLAQLFSAGINQKGELEVAAASWATVRFHFRSSAYKRGVYLVDVVTLEQLPLYLQRIESGVPEVAKALASAREDGLQPTAVRRIEG